MNYKKLLSSLSVTALLLIGLTLTSCDVFNPTSVENPSTTQEDLANAENPTRSVLPGLRAQFARALGATVTVTEFVSDNASVHGSGISDVLDRPRDIGPQIRDINATDNEGIYWNLQELRALCDFLIEEIAPDDPSATDAELAEAHYYRGMAFLMQGENFSAVPMEEDGTPVPAGTLLQNAISNFDEARSLGSGEFALRALAAKARAHRALGDVQEAASFAQQALTDAGSSFLFDQSYDGTTLINNPFLFQEVRVLKELQPLPRLDFLDPKYTTREAPIPVEKAEEMHLILAEAALANDSPSDARSHMKAAITVAKNRPTAEFDDTDQRVDKSGSTRPDTSAIEIAFEENGSFVDSLVLDRPGIVTTPTVSGTHLTDSQIDNAGANALPRLLYLLRQEIFYLEGRRMHDLGIRLPMMLREIDSNPSISSGDLGTTVSVPSYVPEGGAMDRYKPLSLYDDSGNLTTTQVTILHNMNKVLANQRGLVINNPMLP